MATGGILIACPHNPSRCCPKIGTLLPLFSPAIPDDLRHQARALTLLLLWLNRFREEKGGCWRSWKGYAFGDLDALSEAGLIAGSSKAKSVMLTEAGLEEGAKLAKAYGCGSGTETA